MATRQKRCEAAGLSLLVFVDESVEIGECWLRHILRRLSVLQPAAAELVLISASAEISFSSGIDLPTTRLIQCRRMTNGFGESVQDALQSCHGAIACLLPGPEIYFSTDVFPTAVRLLTRLPEGSVSVPTYSGTTVGDSSCIDSHDFFQDKELKPTGWDGFQELPRCVAPCFVNTEKLMRHLLSAHGGMSQHQSAESFFGRLHPWSSVQGPDFLLSGEAALATSWPDQSEAPRPTRIPVCYGAVGRQAHTALHPIIAETPEHRLPDHLRADTVISTLDARVERPQNPDGSAPRLSLIIIACNMRSQLPNSLFSLCADYQEGIEESDYEVLIVENRSHDILPADVVAGLPQNFRHFLRDEDSPSPAAAINFGLRQARGEFTGLMIDGAHMLSPGVLRQALLAATLSQNPFVTVPTYHLGPAEQHISIRQGYDEAAQQALLDSVAWQSNGYELFSVSAWCGANPRGYLAPIMESNCYFAQRQTFDAVGGADERYQQPGGGSLNLDLVRKLGTFSGIEYFSLFGEGSFHQYHGGVTSNTTRAEFAHLFKEELHAHWDQRYRFLERNPTILGSITRQSRKNLEFSSYRMLKRFDNFRDRPDQVWSDDIEA